MLRNGIETHPWAQSAVGGLVATLVTAVDILSGVAISEHMQPPTSELVVNENDFQKSIHDTTYSTLCQSALNSKQQRSNIDCLPSSSISATSSKLSQSACWKKRLTVVACTGSQRPDRLKTKDEPLSFQWLWGTAPVKGIALARLQAGRICAKFPALPR